MPAAIFELRPPAEQREFNLRRWEEVLADPELQRIEGRVETDRHGRIVMSPPPAPRHGLTQFKIGSLLEKLMAGGQILTECPVSTADGVKGVDVAWVSDTALKNLGNRACFLHAPEICVEVLSPSNSEEEIREKVALYFEAGAKEVWICGAFGAITFYKAAGEILQKSELCPEFPAKV